MTKLLQKFDAWLEEDGPAALVLEQHLEPVEGPHGAFCPATFAAGEGTPAGYHIDRFSETENVCLVDGPAAQANRIEPIFKSGDYAALVPQIVIRAGEHQVNLLEAGHRAADALVRCSSLRPELEDAFQALLLGNALPLAKVAPTSLVFGVWDSRGTQARSPRLLRATVRASNVRKLTTSIQYIPALGYKQNALLGDGRGQEDDNRASRGFAPIPKRDIDAGVLATEGVLRQVTLQLGGLRRLRAADATQTLSLQRYLLGLSLTAFTLPMPSFLRQGCTLVLDRTKKGTCNLVYADGRRVACTLLHKDAKTYATAVAQAFGVGRSRTVPFDSQAAGDDLGKGNGKPRGRGRGAAR